MAQYIDKAAVMAEIERQENEMNCEPFTDEVFGKRMLCKHIKTFLDTLEAKEVPVSEDLDEAAMMHFKDVLERKIKTGLETANMTSFKAGALWQKAQDKETIELAEDHAMLAGMNKMEEDMMAKACKFLQEEVLDDYPGVVWEGIIEDFKNYMKGE